MTPEIARGQQATVEEVAQSVELVLQAPTSLRAASAIVFQLLDIERHWTTIRLWIMRIGLAALSRDLEVALDWVWLVDHSVQIGQTKVLAILGIRLKDYPWGRPLTFSDVVLVNAIPMENANKETVDAALEDTTRRTGVPRIIVDDHGADLHGGVQLFQLRHSETVEVYDVKHKAACLLRACLERDETWKSFCTKVGHCKSAMQQTELAFLVPPSQRSKARFMNLDTLVDWGTRSLSILDNPTRLDSKIKLPRLEEKLGWLREYRASLGDWSESLSVINQTLDLTRKQGIDKSTADTLNRQLLPTTPTASKLKAKLIEFAADQTSVASTVERLPCSTEILESCFGKIKYLEHEQSKSGFTGLILALGAYVGHLTHESIKAALERCRVKDVLEWCRNNLGVSVQSQRRLAYATTSAQQN